MAEETHKIVSGSATFEFTNRSGGIHLARLAGHDQVILNEHSHDPVGALRRGATGADPTPYRIVEKSDKSITFEGTAPDNVVVRKTYTVTSGQGTDEHLLSLTITLTNKGTAVHQSEDYYLYTGSAASLRPDEGKHPGVFWNDAGDADYKETSWFQGGWFSDAKSELRQNFSSLRFGGVMSRFYTTIVSRIDKQDKPGKIWAARFLIDHSKDKFKDNSASKTDYAMEAAISLPPVQLQPEQSITENYQIYMGPKEYNRLRDLEGQRSSIMFYGWFTWISQFLNNTMRWLFDFTGNWGLAIILLTIVVRTVLWPLQAKSQNSMKRMGLLAPKMKELQEKFKDDPAKQQAEVMKLYRDYGVNPVGGCLPMLIQIPIFFGFYRVLENAAELRGQGFLWVKDLAQPDTIAQLMGFDINPLPLIMGLTMILQMKLTPQPQTMDKTQKYMFMLMPFFFLFICYNFASALALYWSTQNIFVIFQSRIMKLYEKPLTLEKVDRSAAKAAPRPSMFNLNPQDNDKKPSKNKPPKLGG